MRTWWSSLLRSRDRGSTFRLIAFNAVGIVLFLLWGSHPVAAAADELQVIAVHTASAPRVSMVVEPPVAPSQNGSATESCSVTIDGRPVATTVSPMASGDLSVALVIDTASRITSQELAAVQSGAAEFLLRLPDGAHTMVVAAAGEPEVVAPLSARRAEALSAISALRGGGSRATMAATMLAAQSLESAPPGPRAIIVYTHGPDQQGVLATRLSRAVRHSEAVLNVIRTGTDVLWPSVVDQTGGGVVMTTAENIVQTFGDVAAMLGEQYLVTFEAPDELPAVAQVAFQTGDQEYRTVVSLPAAGAAQAAPQAAPTESSGGSPHRGAPWLIPSLVAGLVLMIVLGVFVRRARQLRHAYGGDPSTEMAGPATGAPPPNKAASTSAPRPRTTADGNALPLPEQSDSSPPAADKAAPSAPPSKQPAVPTASLADDPAQNDPPQSRPRTPPAESKPARSSLSGAIAGRRLARLILDSQPESRPQPDEQRNEADNHQTEDPLANPQARNPAEGRTTASGREAGTKADRGRPENPAEDDPSSRGWLRSFSYRHASPVITLTAYAHVVPGMQREAAHRFAELINGPAPDPRGLGAGTAPHNHVLRLDFADGLDAAGVNVADAQHLVLAHRPPDDLLSQEWALTEDDIVEHNIGLGDDVVMLGRFIGAPGDEQNSPTARFGSISRMPASLLDGRGISVEAFLMRQ